ncbi:MAG: metallophosphoesterase, partial [Clostridiales bacterium]|nr:metallophosphoesterase [Clostridiales bacterium]
DPAGGGELAGEEPVGDEPIGEEIAAGEPLDGGPAADELIDGALADEETAFGTLSDDGPVVFGVVSDTHVTQTNYTTQARTTQAFQFYSDLGVDAVVVAGDLTDNGSPGELGAWKNAMDAGKSDSVKLIASMGNHENNNWGNFENATGNRANDVQIVNGYYFITLSPGLGSVDEETGRATGLFGAQSTSAYGYAVDWLEEKLAEAEAASPDKPIFVFFHHPIRYTFYVSHEWYGSGLDNVFKGHPRAVTFAGHIHSPNNNPMSIWQDGGYTAINTVTLKYFEMESGMIYGSVPPNSGNAAQGLLVTASGSGVTIQNYDFISGEWIDQTWTFDVTQPLPYTSENRKAQAVAPVFAQDARISVTQIGETGARVDFPQARIPESGADGDIVTAYRYDFANKGTGAIDASFRTFSESYFLPMPQTMGYNVSGLKKGTEYEVRIYAYDAMGAASPWQGGWESGGVESLPLIGEFATLGSQEEPADAFSVYREGVGAADLLDVDFSGGIAEDRALGRALAGGSGNIAWDGELGKYTAAFSGGNASQAWKTPWGDADYDKTLDGLTLEATFKADPLTGWVDVAGNMQSAGYGFEIGPDGAGLYLEFWCHVGGYKVPKATGLEYGKWYHAAGVYDKEAGAVKLFVNGELAAQLPASGNITKPGQQARNFVIGGDSDSSGGIEAPMKGAISSVRAYSAALSDLQVEVLANRELPSNDTQKPQIRFDSSLLPDEIDLSQDASMPEIIAADNSSKLTLTLKVDGEAATEEGTAWLPLISEYELPGAYSPATTFPSSLLEGAAAYGIVSIRLAIKATDAAGNAAELVFDIPVKATAPPPPPPPPPADGNFALAFDGSLENAAGGGIAQMAAGSAEYADGVFGAALRASGGSFVRLAAPDSSPPGYSGSLSISGWVNIGSARGGDPAIISNKNWDSGGNPGFAVIVDTRWKEIKLNYATAAGRIDNVVARTDPGQTGWQHIAVVFDAENGVIRAYDNGAMRMAIPFDLTGGPGNGNAILLGNAYANGGSYYNGDGRGCDAELLMDAFAVSEAALTDAEIRSLYAAGRDALVEGGEWDASAPQADLLAAGFGTGAILDSAMSRAFSGAGAGIAADPELGRNVAVFGGDAAATWKTPWGEGDYANTNDGKWDSNGQPLNGDGSTFEAAFKAEKFDGARATVFGNITGATKTTGAGVGFDVLPCDDGTATLVVYMKSPDASYSPSITLEGALEYGSWYHAAAVYDGYEVAVYLNGERAGTSRQWDDMPVPEAAARYFVIGGDIADDGSVESPFTGSVAYVGVHSAALGSLQIETLAALALARAVPAEARLAASGPREAYLGKRAKYSVSLSGIEKLSVIDLEIKYDAVRLEFVGATSAHGTIMPDADEAANPDGAMQIAILYTGAAGRDFGGLEEILELEFKAVGVGDVAVRIESARYATVGAASESRLDSIDPAAAATTIYLNAYDVTRDGVVDLADMAFLAAAYLSMEGDPNWDAVRIADFSEDGVIGIEDLTMILIYIRSIRA